MPLDPVTIGIVEGLVVDTIKWFQKRHQETGHPPSNDEIKARVRGKLAAGNLEGEQFEAEGEDPNK